MTQEARKIELPDTCCSYTGASIGGDKDCDHDYDPIPTHEEPEWVEWTCTKCGMKRRYEVYE